jgi:hypothetical protein
MKNITNLSLAAFLLLAFIGLSSCDTSLPTDKENSATTAITLPKIHVPKAVTDSFNKDYPVIGYDNWYDFSTSDNGAGWYEYDPSYANGQTPENYIVEFSYNGIIERAIYNNNGQKIAIHRKLTSPLPPDVTDAIQNGNYKTWTPTRDREEIFKRDASDQLKVYRIGMEKGNERHTLYFQQDGKLLKDIKTA